MRPGVPVLPLVACAAVLSHAAATAAAAPPARAEDVPSSISVSGQAEIRVAPDEVLVALGVESFDPDLQAAKADNDRRLEAVLGMARRHGIPPERLKTDYFEVEPRYRDTHAHEDLLGYIVRRSVVITLRDLSRFEALLAEALLAGANYVHGVDFRTTELRRHRDEARSLALRAAREKAEAMAREYGLTVGEPLTISEGHGGWWSPYGSWWGPRWGAGAGMQNVVQSQGGGTALEGPTMPGQIAVTAEVSVTFRLGGGRP